MQFPQDKELIHFLGSSEKYENSHITININKFDDTKGWLRDAQAVRLWGVLGASLGRLGRLYEKFSGRHLGRLGASLGASL